MILTISREELQKKLGSIQNIVEKKTTMPILSHFLLSVGEHESTISATDLETAIQEPIEIIETDGPGELCIPARKLFEVVREVETDLKIESEGFEWIKVRAGRSNFRIACMNPEEFPKWPALTGEKKLTIKAGKLLEMIEKTLYAAGESDTRYTLNSLLFHIRPEKGLFTVVGTDGHRLAEIDEEVKELPEEEIKVIVPRKSASELRRFLSDEEMDVEINISEKHLVFSIDGINFLVRLIEGTYPDYEKVIPLGNEKKLQIEREAFVKVLRRVSVISKDRNSPIKVSVKQGIMVVNSSDPDLGEATDEVEIGYDGEEIVLGFNARYILEALNAMEQEKVLFEIQEPLSPTILREEGNDRYLSVIMPIRI
ncbi:MAG: DNA polymerase III subunit beta [Nitrospirae bacterium]|nr:MAG: DNA polymerase III subunit beta [Nitrospirota bacterium]